MSNLRSEAIHLASTLPKGDKTRRDLLAAIKRGGFDLGDAIFQAIHQIDSKRRETLQKTFARLIDRLERELLKHEFVIDRRKTYIQDYYHHEGTRFEGKVVFVDKRDHLPRSKDEVEAILKKAVGIYGYPTMADPGVWSVHIGE